MRLSDTVRPTQFANRPTLCLGRFVTYVLSRTPASSIVQRFAWADVISWCVMSVPGVCAGVHAHKDVHTRAGIVAIQTSGFVARFVRSTHLHYYALGTRTCQRLTLAKVIDWYNVIALLYRSHKATIDWRFAFFDLHDVFWRECLPILLASARDFVVRSSRFHFYSMKTAFSTFLSAGSVGFVATSSSHRMP